MLQLCPSRAAIRTRTRLATRGVEELPVPEALRVPVAEARPAAEAAADSPRPAVPVKRVVRARTRAVPVKPAARARTRAAPAKRVVRAGTRAVPVKPAARGAEPGLRELVARAPGGVGIGLRRELHDAVLASSRCIDWLEIIPENYAGQGGWRSRLLDAVRGRWPILAHGIGLSVGGPDPLDPSYLRAMKELLERIEAPFFSDHVCFATAGGQYFHDLLPLPFSEEAVRWTARRAREASERLERPLVLENITYYALMPGGSLSEGEFVSAVLEEANAGLLLDLNNAYVNAINHGRAPRDVVNELPLERSVQIHLAGHVREGELLIDNHGSAVIPEVWELYREVIARIGPVPTLIEWDNDIPSLDRVLDEADYARSVAASASLVHEACA